MSFWRPPKKTLSGDFASEFGSHSRFGKKLDNEQEVSRLKTINSWLASEKSDLGARPAILITKGKDPVKKILDNYQQRNHRYTNSCNTDFSESCDRAKSQKYLFKENQNYSIINKPFGERTLGQKEDYLWKNPDPEQNLPSSKKKDKRRYYTPKGKLDQGVTRNLNEKIRYERRGAKDSIDGPKSVKNRKIQDLLIDTNDFSSTEKLKNFTGTNYTYRHRRQHRDCRHCRHL